MPRTITLRPATLALCLALAAAAFLSMAQVAPPKPPLDTWPPAKRDVLNIFEVTGMPGSVCPLSVTTGTPYVVASAPNDKWMTVTGAYVQSNGGAQAWWAEEYNGSLTWKGIATSTVGELYATPSANSAGVGWTIRPGGNLVLMCTGAGLTAIFHVIAVEGYYSRL